MLTSREGGVRLTAATTLAILCGCGAPGASAPIVPLVQNARVVHAAGEASFVYTGRFVQTATGTNAQTVGVKEQIAGAPGTYGGRAVTVYTGTENQTGKMQPYATFATDVAEITTPIRVGSNVTRLATIARGGGITENSGAGGGNGVFDQAPQVPQSRWSNTAARETRIADAFAGSSLDDRYHADGSYVETSVPVEGLKASAASYPDGNADYEWPYDGSPTNSSIGFSPPAKDQLNVTFVNAGLHVTELIQLGNWYPSTPPVLASDDFYDAGIVKIPASCGVAKRFGSTAYEIGEAVQRLDIVFGQLEATQRTAYVSPAYGLLCLDVADSLKTYYNYTAFALSNTPLATTATHETLGLQSETASSAQAAGTAAVPLDVRLDLWQGAQRTAESAAIFHSLKFVRKKHQ